MKEQHYRLTLTEAITRYQNREITAKGLLRLYFEIRLRPGWEMKRSPREIYSELGISRTTFYASYAALREEGAIIGDDPDEKLLSIRLSIRNSGLESGTPDCESGTPDCESGVPDSPSEPSDSKSPKAAADNDYANPPYFFQLFLNSLSTEEREKFLKFAEEKAKAMPNPPQLVEAWIAKHHADLY